MFRSGNPEYIYLLALVPVLVVLYLVHRSKRRKALRKFGNMEFIRQLFPVISKRKPHFKFLFLLAGTVCLVIAVIDPQLGTRLEEVKRKGVEVMLALDLSNSMTAEDLKPNRLERAKNTLMRFVDGLRNDKVGLITFAGESYLQLPLTTDYSAAKLIISTLNTGFIESQGTAIGSAITMAMDNFSEQKKISRVLVIITDGENHEDDAIGMAREAAEAGISVFTIGMGSVKGAPVPVYGAGGRYDHIKDASGQPVISKLNAEALEEIASAGGGKFIRSSTSDPDIGELVEQIGKMEKAQFGTRQYTDYEDRFQPFLIAALIFFIAEIFISEKKGRILEKLNIFAGVRK